MDAEQDQRAHSPSSVSLKSDNSMDIPPNFKCQEYDRQQGVQSTMNVSEEREEGGPTSKTTLSGEHGRQSPEQQERPDSPGPSCVSMNSDSSMVEPVRFKDGNPSTMQMNLTTTELQACVRRKPEETWTGFPQTMKDWTKQQVKEWLVNHLNVSQEIALRLYDQEMSGSCLDCFEKQDLLDLGVPLAPAIQIIRQVERFRRRSEAIQGPGSLSHSLSPDRLRAMTNRRQTADLNENTNVETGSSDSGFSSRSSTMSKLQELKSIPIQKTTDDKTFSEDTLGFSARNDEAASGSHLGKTICVTRPFDKIDQSFFYRENDILPPAVGPSNLIDPVHEYHILPSLKELTKKEIIHEFIKEVFCFSASCMNSRSNGTIHFGVEKLPGEECGRVIGQEITSYSNYRDAFESSVNEYFEKKDTNAARSCIRPPQFFQILCLDGTTSNKCVIEVDVIPSFSVTQENVFYTLLKTASTGKTIQQCKTDCLFVRRGPTAINILADPNPRVTQEEIRSLTDDVKCWALARKSAEERICKEPFQGVQGQRLKQLITRGRGNLFENSQLIVVTNKCHSSQLENLGFLKEMKPFAVLEFDPESDVNGTCSFYRKDHIANLHYPSMYTTRDSISTVIGKLNLFRQTSWVFCNGRVKDDSVVNKPLEPSDWLKKRSGEINTTVSFLCNPELLSRDGLLVVFILHSAVTDISSPIMEAFCAIYRTLEGCDNMLCICKDFDVFNHWRQLIETRCKEDITNKCIYALSLNEINCTVNKLTEPQTRSFSRYLPSSGLSSVLLTKKDEEMMTVLEILSENECENTEIETKKSFQEYKTNVEEEFYRGGRVTWWNFYLSEMPGCLPFIKRDKYNELFELISCTQNYVSPCLIIDLFHHPGCGGTTLAMHVLWNLRNKFRCAFVRDNMAQSTEVAVQVKQLLTCGNQEQLGYTPVLLLVDNWSDLEGLKQSILSVLTERNQQNTPTVIILNCERSQLPEESSRKSHIPNVFVKNKLSPKEQSLFSEKLKQLKEQHAKPETFYAFMIMTNNFCETYITNLVNNTMKDLDTSSLKGRLICFLALLNTYVNGSYMSLSLCEQLVGIRNCLLKRATLENEMNPYFTLLIKFTVEEHGTFQAVRFLHQMIAKGCLELFSEKHTLSCGEITIDMLHCDLLYNFLMGKDVLIQNIQRMLIKRCRKEEGNDRDTLFSPLIENIYEKERPEKVKEVLERATFRFEKSATMPQALARHFYLKDKDFTSSLRWAKDAIEKKSNSYIADTLGQVYKSQLKDEIPNHPQPTNQDLKPEVLDGCLKLASNAIDAFRHSQKLAQTDESVDPDLFGRKWQQTYNMSGYNGEFEVIMTVLQVIQTIPLSTVNDRHKRDVILQLLKGDIQMSSFQETNHETNTQFIAVLRDHGRFLASLQPRLKDIFGVFEEYFTYMKPKLMERETAEYKIKTKVLNYFTKYITIFCTSNEEKTSEKASKPKLSLGQEVVDQRMYLEAKRADTFAGILQNVYEKNWKEMEKIMEKWQFILLNSPRRSTSDMVNFILANIVLHSIKPNSKLLKKYEELVALLTEALQKEGTSSNHTGLYYLPMLLMWPTRSSKPEDLATYQNISTYVKMAKRSYRHHFSHMMRARSPVTHFFLGHSTGLKRIVSRKKLDQFVASAAKQHATSSGTGQTCKTHQLWQSGAVWKDPDIQKMLLRVKGKVEDRDIYVHYGGNLKIQVRPVYLGGIRYGYSQEEVSFYLGFSMEGPVAYDIKYENDP